MEKAKLFISGQSQAVRLPNSLRFEGDEVYIKKISSGVLLVSEKQSIWDSWEYNLNKYKEPFMTNREQPIMGQEREGLNEIFD
ncbi:MAG: AbrB/MazE/SpoVT family DNA-binding domain-containing protein [Desulfamplus sp.]|nr:AbrB/MazE/SpoVT family DNA-binding domain-containing protein [Desulfamplus sp.]MBF0390597.1 AbrB/MazE/SpoVT family DNA-binding domain-containing protein [Desulfamplus sp.]